MSNAFAKPSAAGGCGSGNCACKSAQSVQRAIFDDTDYGTPRRYADIDVTLEIDGAVR